MLLCHVNFSMHVTDVGVIIGRWPVFWQVRDLRRPQLPRTFGDRALLTGPSWYTGRDLDTQTLPSLKKASAV